MSAQERHLRDLSWLPQLRELTQDNDHILALWFIAVKVDELGDWGDWVDYINAAANLLAEWRLAGELTPHLERKDKNLRDGLLARIETVYGHDIKEQIRMCL